MLQKLFLEFVRSADRRISLSVTTEGDGDSSLHRQFQRGRDSEFDRLLCALGRMAEYCLSSLIRHALDWRQTKIDGLSRLPSLEATRRREGVEFVFCHLIIETLQQLSVHPIPERDIQMLLNLAFEQFERFTDSRISELYAEALGVISEHRHHQVRHRFLAELRKLRSTESSTEKIAAVLNGMKFFKGLLT